MRIYFCIAALLCLLNSVTSQEDINELREQVDSVCLEPEQKNFSRMTLGYITPWNTNGLELALKYSAKFDFISPTWFSIQPETLQDKFNTKLDGANYVNMNFIKEIREKKQGIKILPRFKCEGFAANTYEEWLKEENVNQFLRVLIRRLKFNKLDGMVFECNHVWILEKVYADFAIMIKKLHEALKKEKMMLILTILPYSESFVNYLSKIRFEYLSKYVDYFGVMTYDYMQYTKSDKPTMSLSLHNAPLTWIKKTLETYIDYSKPSKDDLSKKILLGLPFHGFTMEKSSDKPKMGMLDSSTLGSIVSSGGLSSMKWDAKEGEHILELEMQNNLMTGVYPTKKFFTERLELCHKQNLGGVAIWDLAQGLESFFDEF